LEGIEPGFEIDWDAANREMARRAPGTGDLATPRKETDDVEILSGIFEGRATGAPICAVIRNENTRPGDYTPNIPRPGHADYTSYVKYKGYGDYRGGGRFSGRLTAPLVWAGALAKQVLAKRYGVEIAARAALIHGQSDPSAQREAILAAKAGGDSVGGVIECVAVGVPPGAGEPFFGSLESDIAALLFSVPAVKGVEFGDGFALAGMYGSQANDAMEARDGKAGFLSNHNGGILGGISNGQPIVVRAAFKPTPSIEKEQTTIDLNDVQTIRHSVKGRHDPCIVPRAVPVVEACVALALLDAILDTHFPVRGQPLENMEV
jgi:chorismate synthase